jgi:hypothetical protein
MYIEVSLGEVVDKYTILQIKEQHITDPVKLKNVTNERQYLESVLSVNMAELKDHIISMRSVNQKLWNIEDGIRNKEVAGEFDSEFVELARSVYFTNDERAKIKRSINMMFGSHFVEEKQYTEYAGNQH